MKIRVVHIMWRSSIGRRGTQVLLSTYPMLQRLPEEHLLALLAWLTVRTPQSALCEAVRHALCLRALRKGGSDK